MRQSISTEQEEKAFRHFVQLSGHKKCNLIVVFDAYRVKGHQTEMLDHHNIHVVYTKEAETADAYIEKFAHENGRKYHVTVATSDGLEQIIITGRGCYLLSAREFEREVEAANQTLRNNRWNEGKIIQSHSGRCTETINR